MHTECVLRFGSSSILAAKRSPRVHLKAPPSSLSPSLSGAASLEPETVFHSRQLSSLECNSVKNGTENGEFLGHSGYLYARKFDSNSLNLNLISAKERADSTSKNPTNRNGFAGQKMWGSCLSASSTSRRGPAAVEALQDRLGIQINFAEVPEPDNSRVTEDEERMKRLQALAVLRQGRALGDSRVFRQTFVIRSYEGGADGRTSIDIIVSLFQEVAMSHYSLMGLGGKGFGATPNMNRNRLIWVLTRLHVEVERYPAWPEAVEIDSWTGNAGKNGMRIEWVMRQHGTVEILAKGTSIWAMMNEDTRRLSKLPEDVRAEIEPTFKKSLVPDSVRQPIPKLDNTARHIKSNLNPRRTDLDLNNHVNNVIYVRWAMESLPAKLSDTHDISSLTLEYRRECLHDSVVESLTDIELEMEEISDSSLPTSLPSYIQDGYYTNGMAICPDITRLSLTSRGTSCYSRATFSPCLQYTHLLRMQGGKGEEIVRGRTVWKQRRVLP